MDGVGEQRYPKKGVLTAVNNVKEKLSPALVGQNLADLKGCDKVLCDADPSPQKTNIGGNAITATSFAVAEAGASFLGIPLYMHLAQQFYSPERLVPEKFSIPSPMVNVLNGGKHAGGKLKVQEFMLIPKRGIPFREALRSVTEAYHHLGKVLVEKYEDVAAKNLGDEGGYAPAKIEAPEEAIEVLEEAITKAGYRPGEDIYLALDCAASEFYSKETKMYQLTEGAEFSTDDMIEFYEKLVEAHPALVSIEDPLDQDDTNGWMELVKRLGSKVMIVGDDLYTSNPERIQMGLSGNWANALLLKVNQIGTISEAMRAARLHMDAELPVIVSHRSGETTSALIADLAVGIGARFIKTGAPARGERVAKYNRLLQIEEELSAVGKLEMGAPGWK